MFDLSDIGGGMARMEDIASEAEVDWETGVVGSRIGLLEESIGWATVSVVASFDSVRIRFDAASGVFETDALFFWAGLSLVPSRCVSFASGLEAARLTSAPTPSLAASFLDDGGTNLLPPRCGGGSLAVP